MVIQNELDDYNTCENASKDDKIHKINVDEAKEVLESQGVDIFGIPTPR